MLALYCKFTAHPTTSIQRKQHNKREQAPSGGEPCFRKFSEESRHPHVVGVQLAGHKAASADAAQSTPVDRD